MTHSYAETLTLTCDGCGRDFDAQLWLIVDTAERPDLLERIRAGDLHELACPHCGDAGQMDAPLLLFNPPAEADLPPAGAGIMIAPPLLFSPAEQTTADEDREQARQLVELLQDALGDAWQDDWLAEGLRSAPRALLPAVLSDDPEKAMAEMAERAAAELARLQTEDPARFAELQAALGSLVEGAAPLLPLVERLIQAETWDQTQRIVEQHPELLNDEADRLLATLIEAARMQGDEQAVQMFEEHSALLSRCREVGIEQAFDEKTAQPPRRPSPSQGEGAGLPDVPQELQSILQEVDQLARLTDMARRAQLCRQALTLLGRDENPQLWAALQVKMGNSLAQSFSGDRVDNLEQAIAAYRQALEVRTRQAMPVEWATVMMNLANAYYSRIRGDRADNLEQAIAAYRQALEVNTRQAMPVEWATVMMNLATAYKNRIHGDRADNLEQAIAACRQALEVNTRQAMPVQWATAMMNLANAYKNRIRGDRADNLEQAIAAYRQALEVNTRQAMPVQWATAMMNLANAYKNRIRGDRADNLEQAIAAYRQALEVNTRQAMPVQWATGMMNLAIAYKNRIRGDRADNLEQAIAAYRQALEVNTRQAMPVQWAQVMMNLANAYYSRIRGDRADNLEQAIAAYRQAIEVNTRQAMPVQWATVMMNLATAYKNRIHGDRADNLEQAIAAYRQALEVNTRQAMPVQWATAMMNLANAYSDRIRGDRADNLEQAIAAYRQALEVNTRQAMPVQWATVMTNLATAYSDRIRGDRADNLEQTIAAYRQALEVMTRQAMPVEWAQVMTNLATAYSNRIRGDRADNLEQAIAAYRQALEVMTRQAMPVEWAQVMTNLATAYSNRIRGDRADNLEQAIAAYRQALEVNTRQAMPVQWATVMMNLANAYKNRIRGDRADNLEQAIAAYRQALEVMTRQAMPVEWATVMMNLATAYSNRIRGDRADNLEQAIAAYRRALKVRTRKAMPVEWATVMMNLANAYSDRIRGDRADNLEQAIAAYRRALKVRTRKAMPVEWAQVMMNLANAYKNRIRGDRVDNLEQAIAAYRQALEVFTPIGLPDNCRRAARSLANLYFDEGRFEQVDEPYQLAMQAAENLLQASLVRGSKEMELGEIQGLPARAAYALAKTGKPAQAIVALERGRARLLAEALEQNRRDLEQLEPMGYKAVLDRYRAASQRVTDLQQPASQPTSQSTNLPITQSDHTAWRQQLEQARAELNAAIAAIRLVPGYEDFFLPPPFQKIQQAAAPDAPLVYLATTPVGSVALVVGAPQTCEVSETSKVSAVWLDGLTEAGLREAIYSPADDPNLGGYLGAYDRWRRNPRDAQTRAAWHAALDDIAGWLWDAAMQPVVAHLAALGARQAVLLPAGLLGLLPLHAAWTEDAATPTGRRYALDALALAYAPSASALRHARAGAAQPADGLLAVDNPDNSLVFSRQEIAAVRSYFPPDQTTVLPGAQATRQAVLDRSAAHPVYHFSTHGWAGWREPLQGGLLLAGGSSLTLADILDLRLEGARLAVLSACETGVPGTKTPDEVVSLPTGLVQAGVAGVVASLWAVNDLSTAMLMERFYRLWREDGLAPAEALRQAQIWLRDSSNRELAAYFMADVPALSSVRMPELVASELYLERMLQRDGDARPFEHPFHWAAFTMTGA